MPKTKRPRTVGQRQNDVSKQVEKFLFSRTPAMRRIRNDVIDPLNDVGEVAVIGGLVRDIVRFGVDHRPISDLDLVIDGPSSQVQKIAKSLGAKPNRFGGYNLSTEFYKVDFWALQTTWAKLHTDIVIEGIEDLTKSTFFNWDAIVYSITNNKTFFRDNYLQDLSDRVLEINLAPTPSHKGNTVRALRRLYGWRAAPGPAMLEFIYQAEELYTWTDIVAQEAHSFHNSYLGAFDSFAQYFDYLEDWRESALPYSQMSLFPAES